MVAGEQGVGPARRAAQVLVLNDRGVIEQILCVTLVMLHAVVGAAPDAFEVVNFAQPVARSATRAIALVLGALRFGAEEGDVRQRAIAAVLAAEHRRLGGVLQDAQGPRTLKGVARGGVNPLPELVERLAGREDLAVNELAEAVVQRDV